MWCIFIYEHNKPEQCQLVILYFTNIEVQIVNKAFVYTLRVLQHTHLIKRRIPELRPPRRCSNNLVPRLPSTLPGGHRELGWCGRAPAA